MIRIPKTHYGLAFERTDGGPPWVALKGCKDCDPDQMLYEAIELAQRVVRHKGVHRVQVVQVNYQAKGIYS